MQLQNFIVRLHYKIMEDSTLRTERNLPKDKRPLLSILSFIVFGIDIKLVLLNVFFFFGFSTSTHRDCCDL